MGKTNKRRVIINPSSDISVKTLHENFDKYIDSLKSKEELKKIKDLIERFNNLDPRYQKDFIASFINSGLYSPSKIEKELKQQEQHQGFCVCLKEGHIWKWKKGSRSEKYVDVPPDITDHSYPNYGKTVWVDKPIWVRDCERCGTHEEREFEDVPEEIKEERKQQAAIKKEEKRKKDIETKEKQLVKLQKEISDLKNQGK